MELQTAVLVVAACWVLSVNSQYTATNCDDHSKFGGPCLHRACCRNLQRMVTRHCSQLQQGQAGPGVQEPISYNSYTSYTPQSAPQQTQQPQAVQSYNPVMAANQTGAGGQAGQDESKEVRCRSEEEFRSKNLLTPDGTIDVEKVSAYLTVSVNDPSWPIPFLRNATTWCAVRAAGIVGQAGFTMCKSGAYEFKRCLELYFFEFCPENNWMNSPQCLDAREYVRHCPIKPEVQSQYENRGDQLQEGWYVF
ncbi:uncharacterized protein LOC134538810 [Bacillus rossius redtenbacheri]|uniref:uncharacterized protein LOC134538810 n=1 Tax=Bacillus rossius redtenbacheri TaxID=93214 RepID=UPI002FDE09ED